jgi:predicted hydrocarbon binding protein
MKSGLYYPNRLALVTLQALEEVIGTTGMQAVFHMAGLQDLTLNPPGDNMSRHFDFADFSTLFSTLNGLFGERGAKTLAARAGRMSAQTGVKLFNESPLPEHEIGTTVPIDEPVLNRLVRFSNYLNGVSDQITSVYRCKDGNGFEFMVRVCPVCWGLTAGLPVCSYYEGLLEGVVRLFSNEPAYTAEETLCKASGNEFCLFLLKKQSSPQVFEPDLGVI